MRRTITLIAALSALLVCAACVNVGNDEIMKGQTIGVNASLKTGITGGTASLSGVFAPKTMKNGTTTIQLLVAGPCGETDSPDVASNLNSQANASANTTAGPSAAWASGDQAFVGLAARFIGLGGGQAPSPAAIAAYQTCSGASDPLAVAPAPSGSTSATTSAASGVANTTTAK